MPFVFDFKNVIDDVHTVDIEPKGWVSPITIEYAVAQAHLYDTVVSVVWRVKGTSHTFTIGEQRLNTISNGNYKKHFTEALEAFRDDYITWFTEDKYKDVEWKNEYKKQFGKFIIFDKATDKGGRDNEDKR